MDSDPGLCLLLADADARAPVLADALPAEASESAPKPRKAGRRHDTFLRRRKDADPGDLPLQRWAVVAPEGPDGDRMLEAIEPLRRLREEEQGAPVTVHRVREGMDARESVAWKEDVYWAEDVPEDERAHYLLLLGDLRHVSLDLQQVMSTTALVGRLCFGDGRGEIDAAGYEAYSNKVVRHARAAAADAPDLLFHVAADGTRATAEADARLLTPGFDAAQASLARGRLSAAEVRRLSAESADDLLSEGGGAARPGVLLSVSHGVGAPRGGWRSGERRRREQGALVIGEGDVLSAERMAGQTFLPGGVWFCLACFGAGTPGRSAYHAWLRLLAEEQAYRGRVDAVLASLPAEGEAPFVAALPQAALASPGGPLAVIGHVDLAWTYGFSSATNPSESRSSRLLSTLEVLVRGGRAGVALDRLSDVYREVNDALMVAYDEEESARRDGRPVAVDRRERGHLWMARNDLRGYVLLGDPAVRLPLARFARPPATAPFPYEIAAGSCRVDPVKGEETDPRAAPPAADSPPAAGPPPAAAPPPAGLPPAASPPAASPAAGLPLAAGSPPAAASPPVAGSPPAAGPEDLREALRFLHVVEMQTKAKLAELSATVQAMMETLVAEGHLPLTAYEKKKRLAIVRENEQAREEVGVEVSGVPDKYALGDLPDVDCAALLPICQARCCKLHFPLSVQDLDERVVRWNYARPYQIAKRPDGYCVHNEGGRCGVYAHRPAICRTYDCRNDRRIWADFEKRIPAEKP